MTRFKQHLWLLGLFLALRAFGTNTSMPLLKPLTAGQVNLHISSATANVGDVVPIDFKVGDFINIDYFNIQVNWNSSYLEYQDIPSINLGSADINNFNLSSTATGKIIFTWSGNSPQTLADSTAIFRINFKVKSYTGLPVSVFAPFGVALEPDRNQISLKTFNGFVTINNNGLCQGKLAGLNCQNAPLLCSGDFPYCNLLPEKNKFTIFPSSCGGTENAHFLTFDAATSSISFRVNALNCTGGPDSMRGNGIQFRVLKSNDCLSFTRVICESLAPGFGDIFIASGLTVGERYLIMIDGVTNDVCEYKIEITNGSVGDTPVVSASEVIGTSTSCPNQTGLDFSINNRIDTIAYEWRVDGGGTITAGQGTTAIKVKWGTTAGSVCVKVLGTCGESGFACKPVGISPAVVSNITKVICPNTSYTVGGQTFNTTGVYSVYLPNGSYTGCDSTINLNLTVLSATAFTQNISRTVCAGGSVTIGSQTFNTTGNFTVTLFNGSYTGCDSTVKLNLTVLSDVPFTKTLNRTVCSMGSVTVGTRTYNTTGNYIDTLRNASYTGCDSIVKLNLTVLSSAPFTKTLDRTVCPTGSVTVGTRTYNTTGNYIDTLRNASYTGCDSIVKLNLTVLTTASLTKTLDRTVCTGGSITIGSQTFNTTGSYTVNLSNASFAGCDSIVKLNLTVINGASATKNLDKTICPGDSVVIGGQVFKNTGNYTVTLANASFTGCDSTVKLNLTVLNAVDFTKNISKTVCPNGSVTIGSQIFNTTGNHRGVIKNGSYTGCDSIVNLNLTVLTTVSLTRTLDTTICQGSSIKIGTETFSTAGSFSVTLLNASFTRCDSLVKLNLAIIDITPSATKSGDLSCENKTITLTGSATISPNTATISYEWKNASGTVIGTTPSVSVAQAGIYTLTVRAFSGYTCEKATTITVNRTGIVPNRPELRGDVLTCENRAVNYNIVNPAAGILQYNWVIQGGTINSGTGTSVVSVTWGANVIGKICVNAENGCGTSDSTCLDIEINKIPSSLTILGSGNACPASTAMYSSPVSTTVTNYQWTVPTGATIKRGQGTSEIEVNWGTSAGGQICMTPSNNCGSAPQSCLTVTVSNTPPDSIPLKGLTSLCPGSVDTLIATPNAAITKYSWRVSSNVTILSGENTPTLIVRYKDGTDALIILDIENTCNLKRSENHYVKIVTELPPNLPILGNTLVCSNDTTTYGVSGNATISGYKWKVPKGATIVTGQGSQTISVAWDTVTVGQVCLELTAKNCGLKREVCTNIKVKSAVVDTFSIIGAIQACPGTVVTYMVTPNEKFKTFNWTVPANATLNKGQGTNEIEIKWNNNGVGDVCLEITNDCNAKRSKCLNVTIKTGIDSLAITGVREICGGATATFSVQKDPDAISYFWRVPAGATILSGRGSNQITVSFGTSGGLVVAQPVGGCAENPSSINVVLKNAPDAPATITGASNICQGETVLYKASSVLGIKGYKWQVPMGAFIVGSDSSDEVTVRWSAATGGKLSVKTRNECKESVEKALDIFINRLPQPKAGADDFTCGKQYILRGGVSVGTVAWRVIEKPTAATFVFSDSTRANSSFTVTKSGKYVLTFSEKNNQCLVSDTVSLLFRESPQLTLIDDNCSSDGTQFTVNVSINGTAPFTVANGMSGTITGNTFTSNSLTEGSSYTLIIKDAFGCESNTISGVKKCPCITQTAVLRNNPIVVCFGQKGKVDVHQNAVLDANDTFEYVLHDSSSTSAGNVLLNNKTGEFEFDATKMQFNRTYFIQYRIGNNDNGRVITTDRCYATSNSIPIVFKNKATVNLKGDTAICANSSAVLTLKTSSSDVFNVTFRNVKENTLVSINNARNNTISTVTPSVSTVYKIAEAFDRYGCEAEIGDSATVNIRMKLFGEAGVDQTVCVKSAQLAAVVPPQYKINWRSVSGATIASVTNPTSVVSSLKNGKNIFILTTSDSVCSGYRSFDTVSVFMPIVPKALDLSLEMFRGDSLTSQLSEGAPVGTYSVTRLTNPANGRFDVFNNGTFNYISDPHYAGIAKFKFIVCSDACTGICDTGDVRILIKTKPIKIDVYDISVPNAITPNDDGKNDVLIIDNIEKYPEAELTIFNRWGDILYIGKNYSNTWNGSNHKGDPLPEGTYYYILRLKLNDGKILRGDMTILR